jgi:hypothetical protein
MAKGASCAERVAMCGHLVVAFQSVVLGIISSVVTRARVRPSHSVMLLGLIPTTWTCGQSSTGWKNASGPTC